MTRYVATARSCRDTSLPGDVKSVLRNVGLRSTRQRIAVARLLLRDGCRHVTAAIFFDEARKARCFVSRSTVCNALRQFERAGLLRRVPVHGSKKAWFAFDPRVITRPASQLSHRLVIENRAQA